VGLLHGGRGTDREKSYNAQIEDAFRHTFTIALKALEVYRARQQSHDSRLRRYEKKLHQSPFKAESVFDEAKAEALEWGDRNERMSWNATGHHLKDLWNNGVGVQTALDILRVNDFDARALSNSDAAAYVAGKIRDRPELFILDPDSDPRAQGNPPRFNKSLLPKDMYTVWDRVGIARGQTEGSIPFVENMRTTFPKHYRYRDRAPEE